MTKDNLIRMKKIATKIQRLFMRWVDTLDCKIDDVEQAYIKKHAKYKSGDVVTCDTGIIELFGDKWIKWKDRNPHIMYNVHKRYEKGRMVNTVEAIYEKDIIRKYNLD